MRNESCARASAEWAAWPAAQLVKPFCLNVMELGRTLLPFAAMFVIFAPDAGAETIIGAQYAAPVDRYGHFALGRPHEYARLTATTDAGRSLTFQLPEDEVFEDLEPRLVRLATGEPKEILAIVSQRDSGSRLVLIRLSGGHLETSAESSAIGTPQRWLNPVGVADLDGDGRAEIAAVTTPHIGGTLKVYRRHGSKLVEIAALPGFSNHVYGSPELGLATPVFVGDQMRLLVPDATRLRLRLIALEGSRLVEVGRCAVPAPVTGAVRVVSASEVSIGLASGQQRIALSDCLAKRTVGRMDRRSASNLAVVADAPEALCYQWAWCSARRIPRR